MNDHKRGAYVFPQGTWKCQRGLRPNVMPKEGHANDTANYMKKTKV